MIVNLGKRLGVVTALSLLSTFAYAAQPGNIGISQPGSKSCGIFLDTADHVQAMTVSTAIVNGDSVAYVTLMLPIATPTQDASVIAKANQNIYFPSTSYIYTLDLTAGTFSTAAPGIQNLTAGQLPSGTFSGSVTTGSNGGFVVGVTLSCGTTMSGFTTFVGQ